MICQCLLHVQVHSVCVRFILFVNITCAGSFGFLVSDSFDLSASVTCSSLFRLSVLGSFSLSVSVACSGSFSQCWVHSVCQCLLHVQVHSVC